MGGYGSGQRSDRPVVEQALPLDIDQLLRSGIIRPGEHLAGEMRLEFYDDDLVVEFESRCDPWDAWLRLRYTIPDYWTGEPLKIDDKIRLLATPWTPFGGLRYWFRCPRTDRRVRHLLLPLGGRHFWSRRAYRLGYASERERGHDRALRRVHKLRLRLGGDPADDERPDKPPRVRWKTYNRLIAELDAANRVADGDSRN